jgi:hypothetical protein
VPWWAASLSFLATEISAVTIISVPATAYSENWEYVQFFIGSSLAKLAVAFLFIPAFYRHNVVTIYEFLLHRFGRASQVTASIFFFITRLLGSGVRLMAAALAVAILMGWPVGPTIAFFVLVSIVYIATGGVQAVVWTNVFQALLFLVAGAVTLGFLVSQIEGGMGTIAQVAGAAGRLNVINWGPAPGDADFWRRLLTDPSIVWVAVLNGLVGSMAAFGTDHDLMQRLLTVETRRRSQLTLSLTPLGTLVTLAIYLGLGAALYTFYTQHPALPVSRPDEILPHFVRQVMPEVLRGLMLSAIVLASIDSPLGLAGRVLRHRHLPAPARSRPGRAALPPGVAGQRGGLRPGAGGAGLRLLDLQPDPVAGLQDRGSDLRLAARGVPARPAHPPAPARLGQRGGHGAHGPRQSRPARPVRNRGPRLRLVLARDRRHRGHDAPGLRAVGPRPRAPLRRRRVSAPGGRSRRPAGTGGTHRRSGP